MWSIPSLFATTLRASTIFNFCLIFGLLKLGLDIAIGIWKAQTVLGFFSQPVISGTTLILLLGGLIVLLIGMMSDAISRRIAQTGLQTYKTHWVGYVQKESEKKEEKGKI